MRYPIWILWIGLLLLPVPGAGAGLKYSLDLNVDTKHREISGTARLLSDKPLTLSLSMRGLTQIKIDGQAVDMDGSERYSLELVGDKAVAISYRAIFDETRHNHIDARTVLLMEEWYPLPDVPAEYVFSVTLPEGFVAVAEADRISTDFGDGGMTHRFEFPHPLRNLHLVASTEYVVTKGKHRDIDIEAYFFKEDADLAKTYIDYAQKYLAMFERMLTPYPYRRFAIVENIHPTGFAMPTFTLLGRQIVRLPFIVKTSLGHEILHQWFGNSVYVDRFHGNWSEGLTTYLSDHRFAELEGRGKAYRKQILINHAAYVDPSRAISVNAFITRRNKTESAIGYGRTAMFFHALHERFGEALFSDALRRFIRRNQFRDASWHDIQRAFERTTGEKLNADFDAGLNRREILSMEVKDPGIEVVKGKIHLTFTIAWKGPANSFPVPVTIYSPGGSSRREVVVDTPNQKVQFALDAMPVRLAVDDAYSLMRVLHEDERPPVLADIMGTEKPTVLVASPRKGLYRKLMHTLGVTQARYIDPDDATMGTIKNNTLVIAGYDNPWVDMLLGGKKVPADGGRLKLFKNPFALPKRIFLVHLRDQRQLEAMARKLSHYGKYSELAFTDGKMHLKKIDSAEDGIPVMIRPETRAVKPDKLASLNEILDSLMTHRVIFVGEQHDKHAHHHNQLRIIKKLHESGVRFGVGMEMFQVPYQKSIDAYMAGKIDEATFLKRSEYYQKWRYDYNLYKPIVDFLKKNRIPLVALNLEGDISRKVARKGIENLAGAEKQQLPELLDFTDNQYRDDLIDVFSMHGKQTELEQFDYFLQAQILWDEKMAETAHRFLSEHPEKSMVVLAGNGHLRKRYGIPERLFRRIGEPYVVVLQDDEIVPGVADYVLLTNELKGKRAPVLGVALAEKKGVLTIKSVSDHSPAKVSGLKAEDIILELSGEKVTSVADLKVVLFFCENGTTVPVRIKRDGKIKEQEITFFPFSLMANIHGKHAGKMNP